jgi:hypothetical protein
MLKSAKITAAAVAAACTVAGGVAQADAGPPSFKTPDDKVICFFAKRYAYCDWSRTDDRAAKVRVRGAASLVPSGGALLPDGVPILERGESRRVGRLRCTSKRYGMRCVSLVTGNGFRVGPRMRPVMIDGSKLRRCRTPVPDGAGVFDVRARRVACARARRIARAFYDEREVPGWSCRERRLDLEHFRVRCTRGSRLVRFDHGS